MSAATGEEWAVAYTTPPSVFNVAYAALYPHIRVLQRGNLRIPQRFWSHKGRLSMSKKVGAGETAMFSMRTTAAKRKAAASRLLRGMPPAAKAGRKPAHVLLAESRGGR